MRLEFKKLGAISDPLANLKSLEAINEWISDMKLFLLDQAQQKGYSLQEIGDAQERPRQAVHRTLKSSRTKGFTHPDFEGVSSSTCRYWFDWWSDPARDANGAEEAGRDPSFEAARITRELQARFDAGVLRKPVGGLKRLRNG